MGAIFTWLLEVAIPFLSRTFVWRFLVASWGRLGGPLMIYGVARLWRKLTLDKLSMAINAAVLALTVGGAVKVYDTMQGVGSEWLSGISGHFPTAALPLMKWAMYYFPVKSLLLLVSLMGPAEIGARLWAWRFRSVQAGLAAGRLGMK